MRCSRRLLCALAGAGVAAILIAAPVTAIVWSAPIEITASGHGWAARGALVVTGASTIHVAYNEPVFGRWRILYRRSVDGGTSWKTPIVISTFRVGDTAAASLAANGNRLDAVWLEGDLTLSGLESVVVYRRSTDGGATWKPPVQLGSGSPGYPKVVHDGSGRVVVTWTDQLTGKVYLRLSADHGASFGPKQLLATTTNAPYQVGPGTSPIPMRDAFPIAAISGTSINVAYYGSATTIQLRRSSDGSTWSAAGTLATNGNGWFPELKAAGTTLLLGWTVYTGSDAYSAYRRSTDRGAHWASTVALSPLSAAPSFGPVFDYRDGVWRAAFERCTSNSCAESSAFYRRSTDGGATFSGPSQVSASALDYASPVAVGYAGRAVVLYDDYGASESDVRLRLGS